MQALNLKEDVFDEALNVFWYLSLPPNDTTSSWTKRFGQGNRTRACRRAYSVRDRCGVMELVPSLWL